VIKHHFREEKPSFYTPCHHGIRSQSGSCDFFVMLLLLMRKFYTRSIYLKKFDVC
jgi:hypothetical protein